MTAVRNRYAALRSAAFFCAAISQLQGEVTGRGLLTLRASTIGPGQQIAAQNPAKPIYPISLRTWTPPNLVLNNIQQTKTPAFYEWHNPRRPIYPTSLRTWIGPPLSDAQAGVHRRSVLITRRWNVSPYAAITSQSSVNGSRLTSTLAPLPAPPVRPIQWPNPRGYAYPSDLRTWIQRRQPDPTVQLVSGDWPNPLGPIYPLSLRTWTQNTRLLTTPAIPQLPFDWPNPRGYAYPIELRSWMRATGITLLTAAVPNPLRPHDWPNPLSYGHPLELRTLAQSLILLTLEGQSEVPMTCAWGNPPTKYFPVLLQTWSDHASIGLVTTPPDVPLGIDIGLIVTVETDGLQLYVCADKDVELGVTTSLTIELKVP